MSIKSKLFWGGYIIFMVVIITLLGIGLHNGHVEHIDRNYYCENNGYLKGTQSSIKEVGGINYIECYKEEIKDNKFLEVKNWIIFKENNSIRMNQKIVTGIDGLTDTSNWTSNNTFDRNIVDVIEDKSDEKCTVVLTYMVCVRSLI